jgi:RimJ/RimL family protein N-acetyltransferase/MOSC domain-containing protein YiiM
VTQSPRLETERLVLREWSPAARDALAALNADPVVMEFFPSVQSRAESEALADRCQAELDELGYGLWAVQRRDTGEFIGFTGLSVVTGTDPVAGEVEVGWRLARSGWGHGFAAEAARAALTYGFTTAGLDAVMSMTARTNVRSWRLMERLGMVRDHRADFDRSALPLDSPLRRHVVHRITREQWAAAEPVQRPEAADAGRVEAVALSPRHRFSKAPVETISLVAGIGIEGDAHAGTTVQHRSRKRWRPDHPNLRQVHLLQSELLDELRPAYDLQPGDVGENVLTRGIDLLALPRGARLHVGDTVLVEVMGLRNPCVQLERFADGLMAATLDRDDDGELVRKAGVMGVVVVGGRVRPGDPVRLELPPGPRTPLKPV